MSFARAGRRPEGVVVVGFTGQAMGARGRRLTLGIRGGAPRRAVRSGSPWRHSPSPPGSIISAGISSGASHTTPPPLPHGHRVPEPLVAKQRLTHSLPHGLEDSGHVFDPLEWRRFWVARHRRHRCLSRRLVQASVSRTRAGSPARPAAIRRGPATAELSNTCQVSATCWYRAKRFPQSRPETPANHGRRHLVSSLADALCYSHDGEVRAGQRKKGEMHAVASIRAGRQATSAKPRLANVVSNAKSWRACASVFMRVETSRDRPRAPPTPAGTPTARSRWGRH